MIKLFKSQYTPLRRSVVFTKMAYVQKRIRENTERATAYYRLSGEAVDSSHPLVTIINSLTEVIWSGDIQRFFDVCDVQSPSVCGTVRVGTGMHNPQLRNRGIFYGDREVLCSVTLDRANIKNWYEIVPVKVFTHGRTDISYSLPDGDTNTKEDSFSVIGIDVGLLLYMYHNWHKWQTRVYPDAPQTTPQFVANFVLPNMLASHNDCSWLNRIRKTLEGSYEGVPHNLKRTPFALPSSETFTQATIDEIVSYLTRNQVSWVDALKLIPLPSGLNALEFSTVTDLPPTRLGKAEVCLRTLDKLDLLSLTPMSLEDSQHLVELNRQLSRCSNELWFQETKLRSYMSDRLATLAKRLNLA